MGESALPKSNAFHVVQTDVVQDVADLIFRIAFLDRIGPARYADEVILQMQNQAFSAIIEL
jgi:hypothetical protein